MTFGLERLPEISLCHRIQRWVYQVPMVMVTGLKSIVKTLLELIVVGFGAVCCEKTTSLWQVLHTAAHLTH